MKTSSIKRRLAFLIYGVCFLAALLISLVNLAIEYQQLISQISQQGQPQLQSSLSPAFKNQIQNISVQNRAFDQGDELSPASTILIDHVIDEMQGSLVTPIEVILWPDQLRYQLPLVTAVIEIRNENKAMIFRQSAADTEQHNQYRLTGLPLTYISVIPTIGRSPLVNSRFQVGVDIRPLVPAIQREVFRRLAIDFIALFFVATILLIVLRWRLLSPVKQQLNELTQVGPHIQDNDFRQSSERYYQELDELTAHMQQLIKTVSEEVNKRHNTEQQMQQLSNDFENQIRDRTAELNRSNDQLQAEIEQLHHAKKLATQAQRVASMGHLAAGIAHEVNNPLAVVYSNIATLSEYLTELIGLAEQYREAEDHIADQVMRTGLAQLRQTIDFEFVRDDAPDLVQTSKSSLERIRNIVDELKTFGDHTSQKLEPIEIADLVSSCVAGLDQSRLADIQITNMLMALPSVSGVRDQLILAFNKILTNAVDAMPKGGRIEIAGVDESQQVVITIKDTGRGMTEEQLSNALDPFYSEKEVGSGTGLGLTVAFNLITHQNGELEITSEQGRGTMVTIRLPQAEVSQAS